MTSSLAQPMTERTKNNRRNGPASLEQGRYIGALIEQRVIPTEPRDYKAQIIRLLQAPHDKGGMTLGEASDIITWLKTLPFVNAAEWKANGKPSPRQAVATPAPTKPAAATVPASSVAIPLLPVGLYRDRVRALWLRVRQQQRRATAYRKAQTVRVYETIDSTGLTRKVSTVEGDRWSTITGIRPATQAEAKKLSQKFKRCMICGKKLRVEESVDRGIGPVCFKAQQSAIATGRQSSASVIKAAQPA